MDPRPNSPVALTRRHFFAPPEDPPAGFALTDLERRIVREVYAHRFMQPVHLHVLLAAGSEYVKKRCRRLCQYGYLQRPRAQRSTRALTEELIYGIGRRGLRFLARENPSGVAVVRKDLVETPKKERRWRTLDHQVGVTTVMVALRVACDRAGYVLHWDGQPNVGKYKLKFFRKKGKDRNTDPRWPDAYFSIELPRSGQVQHFFLEFDRGSHPETYRERFEDYFSWWKERQEEERLGRRRTWATTFTHFSLLMIALDPNRMERLQDAAEPVGKHPRHGTWKTIRFSHIGALNLNDRKSSRFPVS